LGNFPDNQAFGKFPRYPGIWEISQIPRHLGNFPDTQAFGKFPRYPSIWDIFQIPRNLGNSPNSHRYLRVEFFKILEISQMTGYLVSFLKT